MRFRVPSWRRLKLPLPTGAFLVLAGLFLLLKLIQPVIPASVILLYMGFAVTGVVIHITLDDDRIRRFRNFFISPDGETRVQRAQRWGLLAVIPLILGWWVYGLVSPSYAAPVEIFQRHPTAGEEILSQIEVPDWAADPEVWSQQSIAEGKVIYDGNCAVCHGESLDGQGPAAEALRYPIRPANFRDSGTIAQLTLPYIYWRLTIGGTQNQFNSAMPRWVAPAANPDASTVYTYDLGHDEAWKVIIYLYAETGYEPRKE